MPDQRKTVAIGKRLFQRMNEAGPRLISKKRLGVAVDGIEHGKRGV